MTAEQLHVVLEAELADTRLAKGQVPGLAGPTGLGDGDGAAVVGALVAVVAHHGPDQLIDVGDAEADAVVRIWG